MDEVAREGLVVDARGIRPPPGYEVRRGDAPPGVMLLVLEGELDMAATAAVRGAVDGGGADVVADLAGVSFMDSSILRELLRADADLRAAGHALVLAAPRRPVVRLLELTGATARLAVAASATEAFTRVRS